MDARPPPEFRGIASRGRIYHVEYLRARPGMEDDYHRFVEAVFRPMLDEMVRKEFLKDFDWK